MRVLNGIKHVRTKILAGYVVLAVICLILGVFAISRMSALHDDSAEIYGEDLRAINAVSETRVALHSMALAVTSLFMNPGDPQTVQRAQASINEANATITEMGQIYLDTNPVETAGMLESFETRLNGYLDTINNDLVGRLVAGQPPNLGPDGGQQIQADFDTLNNELQQMLQIEVDGARATFEGAQSDFGASRNLTILVIALAAALAVALGLLIARAISRPLTDALDAVDRVADGDLTARVESNLEDEIGRLSHSINRMIVKVRDTVAAITGSATELTAAAEQLGSISRTLSSTADDTAGEAMAASSASEQVSTNVHTVASGAEEMGASIREIAGNATRAADVAATAADVASQTDTTVAKLGESSAEIGEVLAVITSIAEQTNLLALNATIEAARAGETGKGFAVVAGEVKELAKETSKATGDIGNRIAAIQNDANAVAGAIAEITRVIGEITDFQSTIASAVEQQTVTTNEIARNVADAAQGSSGIAASISTVAQAATKTTGDAGEILSASDRLGRQADELNRLVAQFRT